MPASGPFSIPNWDGEVGMLLCASHSHVAGGLGRRGARAKVLLPASRVSLEPCLLSPALPQTLNPQPSTPTLLLVPLHQLAHLPPPPSVPPLIVFIPAAWREATRPTLYAIYTPTTIYAPTTTYAPTTNYAPTTIYSPTTIYAPASAMICADAVSACVRACLRARACACACACVCSCVCVFVHV